jgi:ribosomal protein S18 acetylase RimI-like enzyme
VPGDRARVLARPASKTDEREAVALLLESGRAVYPRLAGSREAARRILSAAFRRRGTTASCEVVTVAELEGRLAGAMAAFPVAEGERRARRFLVVTLGRLPPWRWPRAWRTFSALRPEPPARAYYVDSLATHPDLRRRGVGRALLAAATDAARERACSHLALETELGNEAARALYRSAGFEEVGVLRPAGPDLGEAYVCLVRPLNGEHDGRRRPSP